MLSHEHSRQYSIGQWAVHLTNLSIDIGLLWWVPWSALTVMPEWLAGYLMTVSLSYSQCSDEWLACTDASTNNCGSLYGTTFSLTVPGPINDIGGASMEALVKGMGWIQVYIYCRSQINKYWINNAIGCRNHRASVYMVSAAAAGAA